VTISSRLRFVLRWQLAGMLVIMSVPLLMLVVQSVSAAADDAFPFSMLIVGMINLIVSMVAVLPLTLLLLWIYAGVRLRYPAIEGTRAAILMSLILLALTMSIVAGLASHWEMLLRFPGAEDYWRNVTSVVLAVLPWCVLGVAGGRLTAQGACRRESVA
jgi:hypothetical protein